MFEIEDRSQKPHKIGGELPDHGAKIVLESTEMDHVEQAIGSWDRDPKGHRPHYLVDPKEFKIYKTADSTRSVIGTFDVSQPQVRSRCVFVSIHKQTSISLSEEDSLNAGRLLRVLCDIEGVPTTTKETVLGDSLGPQTLELFEGIVPLYAFPGHPEITAPGVLNWEKIREGLKIGASAPKPKPKVVLPETEEILSDPETMDALAEAENDVVEDNLVEFETEEKLEDMKVVDLKEVATGLDIPSKGLKKAEIIDAINEKRQEKENAS